ncbi:glycoside hydrolase family 65 protein [Lactovum miscens]|uniref:Trehalose 6-phosphate phosphorylase n=1 Tax=Lactovum miscens TaxID=190387 RepID=A0A841C8N0_9LACT|nr:glycoside hydrolase family 65 protein [Lactovum miscens]MBB5888704.1 trehalose 6-phosphate phosphorylase [Lactovum miscens]
MTSGWMIDFNKVEIGKISYGQESLMTLGNGYLAWRAAPVWSRCSESHWPGLCIAGFFDHKRKKVTGELTLDDHEVCDGLISLPNPQLIRLLVNGKEVDFSDRNVVDRRSYVDFQHGTQFDKYTVRVEEGYISLTTTKYVDPIKYHSFGFEGTFAATFEGDLILESYIDASMNISENDGITSGKVSDHLFLLKMANNLEIALAAKTAVNGQLIEQIELNQDKQLLESVKQHFRVNESIIFDKVINLATSDEVGNPGKFARDSVESLSLVDIKANSKKYWAEVWGEADIEIKSEDPDIQCLTRMNIFHLWQAAQFNEKSHNDISVRFASLTDKSSVFSYYVTNSPNTARDLLVCLIKRNDPRNEITLVYNLWIYQQITGDSSLMNEIGLEFLLETAKFWLNKTHLEGDKHYHLSNSTLNELHPKNSVLWSDNSYTNLMLTWLLNWVFILPNQNELNLLEIAKKVGFDNDLFNKARAVSKSLFLGISAKGEILLNGYNSVDCLTNIYNLGTGQLKKLIEQLGYYLPENWLQINYGYYLSQKIFRSNTLLSILLASINVTLGDSKTALDYFNEVIGLDNNDLLKKTVAGDTYFVIIGQVLEMIQNKFSGVNLCEGEILISPKLPDSWHKLAFVQKFQGVNLAIEISDQLLYLVADQDISLKVYGKEAKLRSGLLSTFALQK